jgi:type IV secretory pathway VirB2 component (pilin)
MKKKTTAILLLLAEYARAQSASQRLGDILATYLCNLTSAVKNIAGVIAVFVLVAAGLKWVWSREDPGERKQAKTLIENVLTGLIVILAAGGIVYAIIKIAPCP